MALYVLSYDLRNRRDYQKLYDALGKFKALKMLESLWCFNSDSTAKDLRDHFKSFIDNDDGLAVFGVDDWATARCKSSPNDLK